MASDRALEKERLLEELFAAAVTLPSEERGPYLDACCAGDQELRRSIEALLAHHERGDGILDRPVHLPNPTRNGLAAGSMREAARSPIGEELGPYRILELLGQGGMGTVFLAEQLRPVERRVAIKVITAETSTPEILARFDIERRALSLMESPFIARIYDAGETEGGRPYFVMEYVEGPSITTYCDQERLSVEERLRLFLQVCQGIEHAHQRGILHRDLKPTNILVSTQGGRPLVRIIDFGIAKAVNVGEAWGDPCTGHGLVVGTPDYMSPEHRSGGRDIDTRSDLYSLGLVLYRLLVGVLPFEAGAAGRAAGERAQDWEVVRPSERLRASGDAAIVPSLHRRTTPAGLLRQLRPDLDWIALKALEADRNRRYASVSELRADILRYLEREPVLAGPPTARYRLGKFVRNNKVAVLSALVVAVALVASVVVSTGFYFREARARRQAEVSSQLALKEAEKATAVKNFLQYLLQTPAPEISGGETLTVRQALDRAAVLVDSSLAEQPDVRAEVHKTLGEAYACLGALPQAENHFRLAMEALHSLKDAPRILLVQTRWKLAEILEADWNDYEGAERLYREALEVGRPGSLDEERQEAIVRMKLAQLYVTLRRFPEAEVQFRELIPLQLRLYGEVDPLLATTRLSLANLLIADARCEEARELLDRALASRIVQHGAENVKTLDTFLVFGYLHRTAGEHSQAISCLEPAWRQQRRIRGEDHPTTLRFQRDLGAAYCGAGRFGRADSLLTTALVSQRRAFRGANDDIAKTLLFLGELRRAGGNEAGAEIALQEALRIYRRTHPGADHPQAATALLSLGEIDERRGNWSGAGKRFREALEQRRRSLRAGHPHVLEATEALARVLMVQHRFSEAELLARECVTGSRSEFGVQDERTAGSIQLLIRLYEAWERPEEAAEWRKVLAAMGAPAGESRPVEERVGPASS